MRETYEYAWDVLKTPLRFKEITAPTAAQVAANTIALYAKDNSGTSSLYFKDDAGTEHNLGAGVSALDDLTDVTLTGVANGDLLQYNGSVWVNVTLAALTATLDHGALTGLADDDHTQYLRADGTRALSAAWDAGSFQIRAETFQSDVATGTAPFTVASTTLVANLNADLLDGQEGSYYLDSANFTGTDWTDLTDGGETSLHSHAASASSGGGGHLHGLTRLIGDGVTTVFNLLDIAEYLESAFDNGSRADALTYTLSSDGSQVTFDSAPTAAHFIEVNYVVAGL